MTDPIDTADDIGERQPRTMGRRLVLVTALVVIVLTGLVAFSLTGSNDETAGSSGVAAVGNPEPAPAVELIDFDGNPFSLTDYRGTPVVVNFWASWCPFCVAEMPDFESVHTSLGGTVAFVGVNLQDDEQAADELRIETGVTYRLARDPSGVAYAAFDGIGMPTTAFIDADGRIVETVAGQLSAAALADRITSHFGVDAGS